MDYKYTFTVFTPTFNREKYLPTVYESLMAQTFKDFEWLIGDDGSTDGTRELVQRWIDEGELDISYFRQENGGKHRVRNNARRFVKGELLFTLDSDDSILPNTLERFQYHWSSIPRGKRDLFAGVAGLTQGKQDGKILGDCFPEDAFESNMIEIREKYGVQGEKCGFQRTDVMNEFPFPEFEDERFVTEALVWRRIARKYKTLYVNEVFRLYEFTSDSLSRPVGKIPRAMLNPRATALVSNEYIPVAGTLKKRIIAAANYVRCSMHAKVKLVNILKEAQVLWPVFLAMPLGWFLYHRDLHIAKKAPSELSDD